VIRKRRTRRVSTAKRVKPGAGISPPTLLLLRGTSGFMSWKREIQEAEERRDRSECEFGAARTQTDQTGWCILSPSGYIMDLGCGEFRTLPACVGSSSENIHNETRSSRLLARASRSVFNVHPVGARTRGKIALFGNSRLDGRRGEELEK